MPVAPRGAPGSTLANRLAAEHVELAVADPEALLGGLRRIARLGLRFRYGLSFHAYNAGLRVFDETLGRLLPDAWSRVRVTACRKRVA